MRKKIPLNGKDNASQSKNRPRGGATVLNYRKGNVAILGNVAK